ARSLHRLEAHAGAEIQRRRSVGHDQAESLALGLEQLRVRLAAAGGQAPVDVAGVVADRIAARLRVFHAPPAKCRRRLGAQARSPATRCAPRLGQAAQGDQLGKGWSDAITLAY